MNFLHFILLVLLGFLSPSLAAVARQTTCVPGTGKINQDLGHSQTMGVEPADHLDLPLLLLAYGLKCTEIPNQKPKYQGNRRVYLNDNYCATWFDCQPDGKELQTNALAYLKGLLIANRRRYRIKAPVQANPQERVLPAAKARVGGLVRGHNTPIQ